MDKTEMLSVYDVQAKLGISKQFAYTLVNKPDFPKVRAGRKILIPADRFDEWMRKGGTANEHEHC